MAVSSGSRAVSTVPPPGGAWGLPRGCAVASTDKGAGSDWIELGSVNATRLMVASAAEQPGVRSRRQRTQPPSPLKDAHSQDNPKPTGDAPPKPHSSDSTPTQRGSAAGTGTFHLRQHAHHCHRTSNGGAAVLRAAGMQGDWLDGAVAIAANTFPAEDGRPGV
ncbi:MAG: hypothetical protein IPK54_07985 [Dokdonella sp.]|nr:hypothetical protein [Dokdonella sp.]